MKLLDLPIDMILRIAASLPSEGRRRLSKTNRKLFELIREQKNWRKYQIQEYIESLDVFAFQKEIFCFGMDYASSDFTKEIVLSISHRLPHIRFFYMSGVSVEFEGNFPTPYNMSYNSETAYVPNPKEHTLALLKEVLLYYAPEFQTYRSTAELFDIRIAETIAQGTRRVSFMIESNSLDAQVQNIYHQLLLLFIRHTENNLNRKGDRAPDKFSFHISQGYLPDINCTRAIVLERRAKKVPWRREMIRRLRTTCEERNIQNHFTKDVRKLKEAGRFFRIQYGKNGVLEGRFTSGYLKRRRMPEEAAGWWGADFASESEPDQNPN